MVYFVFKNALVSRKCTVYYIIRFVTILHFYCTIIVAKIIHKDNIIIISIIYLNKQYYKSYSYLTLLIFLTFYLQY